MKRELLAPRRSPVHVCGWALGWALRFTVGIGRAGLPLPGVSHPGWSRCRFGGWRRGASGQMRGRRRQDLLPGTRVEESGRKVTGHGIVAQGQAGERAWSGAGLLEATATVCRGAVSVCRGAVSPWRRFLRRGGRPGGGSRASQQWLVGSFSVSLGQEASRAWRGSGAGPGWEEGGSMVGQTAGAPRSVLPPLPSAIALSGKQAPWLSWDGSPGAGTMG